MRFARSIRLFKARDRLRHILDPLRADSVREGRASEGGPREATTVTSLHFDRQVVLAGRARGAVALDANVMMLPSGEVWFSRALPRQPSTEPTRT